MRIGIFLDNWGKQAGGGHSYAKTVIEYFSSLISNHEFIFIINTTKNELPQDYKSISNFVLYNPFVRTNNEDEQKRKEIKSLGRLLKTFNFFIDRLKLTAFILFRDKLKGKIESYNQEQRKDPAIFKELIKNQNIQCVYYPTAFTCEDYDVPFYATIWDLGHLTISVFPEVSGSGQFESRQKLLNTIIPRSYRIVSESVSGKSEISEYYNVKLEKIIIVPQFPSNLIHLQLSESEIANILNKFNLRSKTYLFYPAQFWPHKNHYNLIKSIAALKKDNIIIELILTGSDQGNLKYTMDFINNQKLADQIRYLGFVSDEEMKVLYKNAFAMIFPSLLGPTNMPISEAIASGCPVICSDFAGHREQAGDAALYFNPEDYSDIKEKIKILINDKELRNNLVIRGIKVSRNNSVENVFKNLLNSFDEFEKIRYCWGN